MKFPGPFFGACPNPFPFIFNFNEQVCKFYINMSLGQILWVVVLMLKTMNPRSSLIIVVRHLGDSAALLPVSVGFSWCI